MENRTEERRLYIINNFIQKIVNALFILFFVNKKIINKKLSNLTCSVYKEDVLIIFYLFF